MTLEDFFTLTEMKDGLTAPSRVAELVTVMQKEKDCVVKNVGDATRQWAAVASTIAATENKDCLDLFIKLDGLSFIDRWLRDAPKLGDDASDSFVEESITALLRALEKLHIDSEKSISSGIWLTVKNLLGHNSSRVQDKARTLFDSWKEVRDSDSIHQDVQKVGAVDIHLSNESVNEATQLAEPSGDEVLPSRSSDGFQPEKGDVQIQTQNNQLCSQDRMDGENKLDHVASSVVSNSVQEGLSIKEEPPLRSTDGTTSIETCNPPVSKQGSIVGKSDLLKLNVTENEKLMHKINNSLDKVIATEISSASSTLEHRARYSGADAANSQGFLTEPAVQDNVDASDTDSCQKITAPGDVKMLVSELKSGMDDMGAQNQCSTQELKITGQDGKCSNALQDLSGNETISGKPEDPETSFSSMEDSGAADEDKEHTSNESDNLANASSFSKKSIDTKSADVNDRGRSVLDLEYGMVDALEVARQVAQEVEREVGDYREPFCSSSSEKISGGGIRQPGSPDSINGKQDLPIEVPPKEVPTAQGHSAEPYREGEGRLNNSDNLDIGTANCINDKESSQVTEAAQAPEVKSEKGLCDFDLNEEVCSDDMDNSVNYVSAAISVVSTSRAAAAPGLPVAPLQFEGVLGWRGSAATSAFRPASPRRTPDSDKTLSVGGTCIGSKQRQNCLDIDLNLAEDGDDKAANLISGKQISVSSGLPSGDSSVELSPRRSERLKLDLNRIGDNSDAPQSNLRTESLFCNRNFRRSPSPALSSSSQPSMRNIDLNDQPSFHNDSSDQGPYHSSQTVNAHGGSKTYDPVISIMGTRVEVSRKVFVPQTLSLQNGKAQQPAMDANAARIGGILGMVPTVPYTHSPFLGYNGLTTGPAMSFSSAMYGPGGSIPYMVDSRGAPVVPQIVGSASAVPPSQPPFIMSMMGTQPVLNGAGSSRPNFDLNSGFVIDGGNRDSSGLRQFFVPGSMEEHLRANSQPSSSSGVGRKRTEPDSGWDTYPVNYKLQQPPWK